MRVSAGVTKTRKPAPKSETEWRRERDSNPRYPMGTTDFESGKWVEPLLSSILKVQFNQACSACHQRESQPWNMMFSVTYGTNSAHGMENR